MPPSGRRWLLWAQMDAAPYIAAPGIFVLHTVDEFVSGFPEWATRHFGTTSTRFYVASHVLLISGVATAAWSGHNFGHRRDVQTLFGGIAAAFIANGLFHVVTTLRFREKSPGLTSGVGAMIPGGAFILRRLARRRDLSGPELIKALILGAAINGAAVGSLRIDMPALGDRTF